jgi:tetratricopeptide (TPR) repeat protein
MRAGRLQDAEPELRTAMEKAVARGEFQTARACSGNLADVLRAEGRYVEALRIVEQMPNYTKRAGLGPWSQLLDESHRLSILLHLPGNNKKVLRRITKLHEQMKMLGDRPGAKEAVLIWRVREAIWDTGRDAAIGLEKWEQALEFGRNGQQSKSERGASSFELAIAAFFDYGPLLRLKRYDEAQPLLYACRDVFEREHSIGLLGKVYSGLADLEHHLGRPATAQQFEKTALRFKYTTESGPDSVGVSHFNIANYIIGSYGAQGEALAHRLAATLIVVVMESPRAASGFARLVRDLRNAGPVARAALPAMDFTALCATVEKIEGVRFRAMMERLAGGAPQCDQRFQQLVAAALEAATKPE